MSMRKKLQEKFSIKTWSEKNRFIASSLIFLAISAILLTWFLEYRYFINDFARVWAFVFTTPFVFLFNAFLIWLIMVALWALLGRPVLATAIMMVAIFIISYIHIMKFNSRGYPLLPEDFQLASEVSSLSKFVNIWGIVRLIIAIIMSCALLGFFAKKCGEKFHLKYRGERDEIFRRRHLLIQRVAFLAIAITVFMTSTIFVRHNEGARYEDIFLGTHFTAWNQNRNYDDNGFVLGFLYNFQKLRVDAPKGYGEEQIANIKEKYRIIAKSENAKRKSPKDENVSVVIILNESFFDPSVEFQGLKFSDYYQHEGGDVLPNLHKIEKEAQSGLMYSLDYGGGTANIEFETFTSLTNFWLNTVPYTALVPKAGNIPSIAQTLKDAGHSTIAIHPYNGGMYKRNISLKNEGFDEFTTEIEMEFTEHEGTSEYINDKSAYEQTLKTLRDSEDAQVIGLITMQNHTPYNVGTYEENEFKLTNEDVDEGRRGEIETYYQTLHSSDAYLGEFIEGVKQLDKKVVVLFYGDHSAGLFDNTNNSEDKKVRDLSRVTPYFIYANYDAGLKASKNLPTTTPNCMVNTLLNRLNWQKPAHYYLVDEVCKTQPIMATTYLDGLDFEMTEVLNEYKLLTYDILAGQKYWMNN